LRINQKITEDNQLLFKSIEVLLNKNNISSSILRMGHLYYLSIEGIKNVENCIQILPDDSFY
jgi:hypothetical protein